VWIQSVNSPKKIISFRSNQQPLDRLPVLNGKQKCYIVKEGLGRCEYAGKAVLVDIAAHPSC